MNYNKLPNSPFDGFKWAFIYLLKLGSKYKIGRTINLRSRIKAINHYLSRNGKPPVTVEHYFRVENGARTERQFHDYFADKRTESETGECFPWSRIKEDNSASEWFSLSPEEVEYIKSFGNEI